jgi:hypothetical protein
MNTVDCLIFLHITKTGGTTLYSVLDRQFPRPSVYHMPVRQTDQMLADLLAMPDEQRRGIRLIRGHIVFGVHRALPQACGYITMLRDPVDRIVSHYYYVLATPQHRNHELVTRRAMSLADYATSGLTSDLDNGQTRVVSGIGDEVPIGGCHREHVELAIEHIDQHFALAGVTERYDETLLLAAHLLGWRDLHYERHNVTPRRAALNEVPEADRRAIAEYNAADVHLYQQVRRRFDAQIAALRVSDIVAPTHPSANAHSPCAADTHESPRP